MTDQASLTDDRRIRRFTQVQGIPLYEQLARLPMSSGQLYLLIIGVSVGLHLLASIFGAEITPDSIYAEHFSTRQLQIGFVVFGLATGLLMGAAITGSHMTRVRIAEPLQQIDPDIVEHIDLLQPRRLQVLIFTLFNTALVYALVIPFCRSALHIDLLDAGFMMEQGLGAVLGAYVSAPLVMIVSSIGIAVGVFGGTRFSVAIAQTIRLDIFRIDEYHPLIVNARSGFITGCVAVSLCAFMTLMVQNPGAKNLFIMFSGVVTLSSVIYVGYVSRPLWILAERFNQAISAEKDCVIAVLDGADPEILKDTWLAPEAAPTRLELANYLASLKTLSPWPVDSRTRTMLLFGLLPPFTWFMAATVENLVY